MNPPNFENHFKDLFHNTTDLIQFVSANGIIQLVNNTWLHNLEYELYEVVGRNVYDYIHPDYSQSLKRCREEALATGKLITTHTAFITKSGKNIFAEGHINSFISDDNLSFTRGIFKNITQRHLAEKKLEESERRLSIFFRQAPDAIIIIDELQRIVEWNPKAEIIFGFTAGEVMGKLLSDIIIPAQYRTAHKKGMEHFLKTGEGPVLNKTIEITALHKKGNEFYVALSISSVKVDDQWMFIGFLSDISERKKTEETLIYKEAELLQAKLLEEKKDEFISIASHELKTPLTMVKAYAQLALTAPEKIDEKTFQYLTKIDQFTNNISELINNLLDVSRIHGGKLKLNTTAVDISSFLSETLNSVQHIIASHKILITENAHAIADIDTLRMEQVISNLITNAAKYSPGKDEIVVSSVIKNNEIIISFTDYGIGIPEKNLNKIFERFYRVAESSSQFSGLGIGLFISSEIIKQHKGKIWVKSELTKGSTFSFSLPLIK